MTRSTPDIGRTRTSIGRERVDLSRPRQRPQREPDPLAGIPEGLALEAEAAAETDALMDAFRERKRREQQRFELVTDSEFWFAVCFQSREQKEAFLAAMIWLDEGDKYLDGTRLARRQGITLPAVDLRGIKRRVDRTWERFVRH